MKKIILLIVILLSCIEVDAQEKQGKCVAVSYSIENQAFSDWQDTDIPVTIDFSRKKIVIYSKEVQVIDYVGFVPSQNQEYNILSSQATDSKYQTINIQLFSPKKDLGYIVIGIEYSDIKYMYIVK